VMYRISLLLCYAIRTIDFIKFILTYLIIHYHCGYHTNCLLNWPIKQYIAHFFFASFIPVQFYSQLASLQTIILTVNWFKYIIIFKFHQTIVSYELLSCDITVVYDGTDPYASIVGTMLKYSDKILYNKCNVKGYTLSLSSDQ